MSSLPKVRRSLWEGSGRQREDTNVLGGSLDLLPQELGRRTLEPGSCFLEQAWDAALKDFGRLLPAHVISAYQSHSFQSPLEIPD